MIYVLLPLFNRHRLRFGDMIGGTLVVLAPRETLLRDLAEGKTKSTRARYNFAREQLQMYGEYELKVLEEVLRESAGSRRKRNSTLEQLSWSLHEPGQLTNWDGLSSWFVETVDGTPDARRIGHIRDWYDATKAHLDL